MRKKTLISIACGLAAISCAAGVAKWEASASTTYGELLNDNFESAATLDTEKWNELAAGSGATVGVNNNVVLTYDLYHGFSVATKNPITVADTDCLLIEFDMVTNDANGCQLVLTHGSADTDLVAEATTHGWNFYGDAMLGYGTSWTVNKQNADKAVAPMWTAWRRNQKVQVYIHPDGSTEIYQNGNELISYLTAANAPASVANRNGHLGFAVIGAAAGTHVKVQMNNFKVGTFADSAFAKDATDGYPGQWVAAPANVNWILDDSNPTKAGLSDNFVTNQTGYDLIGWSLANNYLNVNENAAEVVSKAEIPAADARIDRTFILDADWDVTGLGAATAQFTFGNAAVGIAKHDDKNYLTIWDGTTVVAENEVALGKGVVNVTGYGNNSIKATFNGVSVTGAVESFAGAFGYEVTAGAANVTLDNLVIKAAGDFERLGGVSQATDFTETPDEDKWYIGSAEAMDGMPTGGGVSVKDGQIVFMNAGDGSMIATKEKYNNYEFGFDLTYIEQEGQEDDDGNITRAPSFFPGFVYGMPNHNTFFGSEDMIYFQKQTVDLLGAPKFADGSTRVWLSEAQDMYTQNKAGKVINFKFVAQDGTITVTITNKTDALEMYKFQLFNQDTYGHVSIQTTGCGNFELDNMYIINLDDVATYQLTQKTIAKQTKDVLVGATLNGAIDLGDMTNKTAVFSMTDTVEGFTLNADGTYTYVAPATAPTTPVVVNYTVAIDDFDLGFVKPVGNASQYTVNGQIEINVTVEEAPAPSSGCLGSTTLGSMVSVLGLGLVTFLAKKGKKED